MFLSKYVSVRSAAAGRKGEGTELAGSAGSLKRTELAGFAGSLCLNTSSPGCRRARLAIAGLVNRIAHT